MPKKSYLTKTVFDWDYFSVYLSGPIDFGRETAVSWRELITKQLVDIGFKPHQVFDPCKKPLGDAPFNLDNEGEIMQRHRSRHEWSDLMRIMSQIVHIDLRLVDKSDLIIVNLPKYGQSFFDDTVNKFMTNYQKMLEYLKTPTHEHCIPTMQRMQESFLELLGQAADHRIPTFGTLHEIVVAHMQQKPILLAWEGGKETCSAWLMYLVGHENVFGSLDEIITRLDNISKGKTAFSAKEWLLLDLSGKGREADREAEIVEKMVREISRQTGLGKETVLKALTDCPSVSEQDKNLVLDAKVDYKKLYATNVKVV